MSNLATFATEARLQDSQYRGWAQAKRDANGNPRAPYRWSDHDITSLEDRAAMFDRMGAALEAMVPHEDEIRALVLKGRKAA